MEFLAPFFSLKQTEVEIKLAYGILHFVMGT